MMKTIRVTVEEIPRSRSLWLRLRSMAYGFCTLLERTMGIGVLVHNWGGAGLGMFISDGDGVYIQFTDVYTYP